jgi:hypothetical protein
VPAILSDPVADLVAVADKLRADDRLITDSSAQLADLEAIFTSIRTLQAVAVRRVREAAGSDATSELHGQSTKAWLHQDQCLSGHAAGRYMRLALQLPFRRVTQAAFDAADISTEHASAILTALSSLPHEIRDTVEPHLVERARLYPPEEIAGFVDELLDALGLDKATDVRRERRFAERGIDLTTTMDGHRSVSGSLTPDVAEQLEKALELAGAKGGPEDDRTPRQRHHDALAEIANAYLQSAGTPSFNGAPRTVIVTMDLETLENQLRDAWIDLASGAKISAATARRLACNAGLIPAVLGRNGEVLDIGQADHEFTVAIRRAAWLRDGGRCAFPDCQNKPQELHHIKFRRHGGPTSLHNAAWLCNYHHWLVHEGGWTLHRTPDNTYEWTGPRGQIRIRRLDTSRHL